MLIYVTQRDIDSYDPTAKPRWQNCPVAKAIQRITGDQQAGVMPTKTWFRYDGQDYCIKLPWSVGGLIGELDMTGKMQPFCFDLTIGEVE